MTRIAVVDHGAGNLVSIGRGLQRAGADVVLADNPASLAGADGIVLPGVGTTGSAMQRLRSEGLVAALREWSGPLLGICVGLQLLFDWSDEHEGGECLGLIPGRVQRLEKAPLLPHIGWNDVTIADHPLFAGIPPSTPFYFVHSFAPVPADPEVVIGRTEYGIRVRCRRGLGQQGGGAVPPRAVGSGRPAGPRQLRHRLQWGRSCCVSGSSRASTCMAGGW